MKISIDGNIGCGKSSLLSKLCQETRFPVFLEPVNEWNELLTLFYQDPSRWGLSLNTKILLSFHKFKNNDFASLYERSPLSTRYIFCELQFEQGDMTEIEFKLFNEIFKQLCWIPDLIIYIKTTPEVSMERMRKRNRDCENNVSFAYIKAVHDKYEELVKSNKYNIKIIDGNQTPEQVYNDAIEIIKSYIT
jgi:deoxyadenosine/deoxycytidine kinase